VYLSGEAGRKGQPSEERESEGAGRAGVARRLGRQRTALVSKVSMGRHSAFTRADVVRDGFKFAQDLLHFIDDAFILQDRTVVRQVYGRRLGI